MEKKSPRKIGIFYMSRRVGCEGPNWSRKGNPVLTTNRPTFPAEFVFVRCAVAKASTLEGALSEAKPRRGETLMNTHYID